MTNEQLYLAVGVPLLFNALLAGVLIAFINSLRDDMNRQFKNVDRQFDNVDRQFDTVKELWRSELHRVEGILDARLKHLEER